MPAAVITFSTSQLQRSLLKLRKMLTRLGRLNLLYTVLIFLNHFAYGITTNLVGATLVDLRFIFGVSLNVIAYLPVATGLGYLIGSLASYTYGRLNRQLMLIAFVLLMAVTMALLPRYGHLGLALPALVLSGIGSGAWDAATSIWLVELWPVGNSAVLQGSQFAWGAGSIVAPMMVSPFVYGDANVTADNQTLTVEERVRRLAIPYEIVGVVQLVVPIILFVLFFVGRYEKPTAMRLKNEESDEEEEEENEGEEVAEDLETARSIQDHHPQNSRHQKEIPNRRAKLLLCGLVLATYGTVEIGHFSFSAALFQQLPVRLSAATAAHLLGVLSATYALGRLASAFISLRLQPDTILWYHFALLFGSLSLLFFGRDRPEVITVSTALLGYGFSACWPAVFAFAERHLRLTDGVCSLFSCLSGAVSLVIPLVLGQTFHSWPLVLFYLEFAFLAVSLALYIWVKLWIAVDNSKLIGGRRSRRRRRRRNSAGDAAAAADAEGGEHSHIY